MVLDASVCFKTGLTFAIDLFLWWSCIDYCECLSIEDASALGTTEHWTICWLGSCRFIWFNIFVCMLLTPIALGRKCLVTIVTEANKGETVSVHEMVWGGGLCWKIKIAHRFSSASCSTETALAPMLPVTQPSSQSDATSASIQQSNMFSMVRDSGINVHIAMLWKAHQWVSVC